MSKNVCWHVVDAEPKNIQYVPEGMKTPNMCWTAFYTSSDLGYEYYAILAYIPFPEVCLESLKDSVGGMDTLLNKTLEDATGERYNVEQVKSLRISGTVQVQNFITSSGVLRNQEVCFNTDKKEFLFKPLKQK